MRRKSPFGHRGVTISRIFQIASVPKNFSNDLGDPVKDMGNNLPVEFVLMNFEQLSIGSLIISVMRF